jgi:hypothetical protein
MINKHKTITIRASKQKSKNQVNFSKLAQVPQIPQLFLTEKYELPYVIE